MFLQKLEIQGFKSFADKTTFLFPGYQGEGRGITAVIGPNGSGKSNVADAVRWVLGEQSLKLLRSKRAEDVIFFGSTQKAQKGFCEVSLTVDNDDRAFPVDYSEVVITRRLYRDGASEYLLNKNKTRLADIALMLAQAHIGQRSYSVIGQGMVDAILHTAPSERKEFFNEAVGVRQYQMKRDSAASKLKSTNENLVHASTVLSELEPKMRFFARQLKRLEEREGVEREYRNIQRTYTNVLWNDIADRKAIFGKEKDELSEQITVVMQKQQTLEQEFAKSERFSRTDSQSPFHTLNKELSRLQNERQEILTRISVIDSRLQTELVASGKGQLAWLSQRNDELIRKVKSIDEDLTVLAGEQAVLAAREHDAQDRLAESRAQSPDETTSLSAFSTTLDEALALHKEAAAEETLSKLKDALDALGARMRMLKNMLDALLAIRTHTEQRETAGADALTEELRIVHTQQEVLAARISLRTEELEKARAEHESTSRELEYLSLSDLSSQHAQAMKEKGALAVQRTVCEKKIADTQSELDALYHNEKETHRTLLALQKEMSVLSKERDGLRDELTRIRLELAKLDAHQEELLMKICDELRVDEHIRTELVSGTETPYSVLGFLSQSPTLNRDETREQIERLKRKLEQIGAIDPDVVSEHEEAEQRYTFLNTQVADLSEAKTSLEGAIAELDGIIHERFEKNLEGISKKFGHYFQQLFAGGTARLIVVRREKPTFAQNESTDDEEEGQNEESTDAVAGIEIEATPPGKKFKSLSFLSGGEKALTAIALLCAILAQNPSPFVVLDEVDAALDESNANRFAAIIKDLSVQTQFIIITHNRVTMHIGHVLYGVTMGQGGISNVLSLDIRQLDGIVNT